MMKRKVTILWLISLASGRIINSLPSQTPYTAHNRRNELKLITDGDNENSFQSSDRHALRDPQLSEADWSWYNIREPNGSGTYAFGYDNAVDSDGNEHFRSEERLKNGTIIGEYGHTDYQNNRIVKVIYAADSRGYRANTQIEPLEDQQAKNLAKSKTLKPR